MQNRLIQSAAEAFAAADISRSRSNSGCSSHSGRSTTRSPAIARHSHNKLFRSSSMRLKASPSLQSIQDVGDGDSSSANDTGELFFMSLTKRIKILLICKIEKNMNSCSKFQKSLTKQISVWVFLLNNE